VFLFISYDIAQQDAPIKNYGNLVFVLPLPVIDNFASCGIRAVVNVLHAKNTSVAGIDHELYGAVCGQSVMTDRTVRQLRRSFRDRR
jgi:hypothetical protein